LQQALRYLGYRPRSEAEIRTYLGRRGYLPAVSNRVLEKLRSLNYVDDESFARNWALTKAQSQGYGPRRIEQELRAKGIVPSLIREVIRETLDHCDEKTQAKRLLAKRFHSESLGDVKTLRRAVAFLQRRGYSSQVISDLLRCPNEEV
jgi:regulatory protein